jgi:hypothetical protein
MVHPNALAIEYLWDKFKTVYISETCYKTMDEVAAIQKGLQHRPFNLASESHHKFLQHLKERMNLLQDQFAFMKF